jgi:general stress protein YciG
VAGNVMGGQQAAVTNKKRYGRGFYAKIGALGGRARVPKGFGVNHDLASSSGAKGGKLSKRGHRFIGFDKDGLPQYQRTR